MKSDKSKKGSVSPATIMKTDKLFAHHTVEKDHAWPEVQFVPPKNHRNNDIGNLIKITSLSKKSSSF